MTGRHLQGVGGDLPTPSAAGAAGSGSPMRLYVFVDLLCVSVDLLIVSVD